MQTSGFIFGLSMPASRVLPRLAPFLFVLLWSTGFIFTKLGMPFAPPLTFLVIRFVLVVTLLTPFILLAGVPWPRDWKMVAHVAVAGVLLHATYLGGVFSAIDHHVPAGLVALVAGLQPLVVNLIGAGLLKERPPARHWLGLALGLAGVLLVLSSKWGSGQFSLLGFALTVMAMLGMSVGTLYQKHFGGGLDFRITTLIQYLAATLVLLPLSLLETRPVVWTMQFGLAMAWLVLVLSLAAIFLLFWLIRQGEASKVSSLFYLVPPTTAVMASLILDEPLTALMLLGIGLAAAGVALVVMPSSR